MRLPTLTGTLRLVGPALLFLVAIPGVGQQPAPMYVAPNGRDASGTNGSAAQPFATLSYAVLRVSDGGTVIVRDGAYSGRFTASRRFTRPTVFRAENAYRAKLQSSSTTQQVVWFTRATNIELSGFEITRPSPAATGPVVVHVETCDNITLRNNIIHDSYSNDLLKINSGSHFVLVEGNVFYNQQGSDEHMDVNGTTDVTIRDNIFFNDFEGSGRVNNNTTSSFIVIKNSSELPESRRIQVQRNVFLNWQGSAGANFVLVGEDGKPFYEAQEVMVENNLMLGNSPDAVRAPLGVKGGKLVTFRNNTVAGNLPGFAFAARLNQEVSNPVNDQIYFYNNIWSDPTGTMGEFSNGRPDQSRNVILDNNLYWNGGQAIAVSTNVLNYTDDQRALLADPRLPDQGTPTLPRWTASGFPSGQSTIRQEFERLVLAYGVPLPDSPLIGRAEPANSPAEDILGRKRDNAPDLGAYELSQKAPTPAAVVDGAAFRPRLAPGALASLFGRDLSEVISAAGALPLPQELAGVSLKIEGQAAPLLYVSPTQINFQVPFEAPLSGSLTVTRLGVSGTLSYVSTSTAPAIFEIGGGVGAILHASTFKLVTAQDPAKPGEIVAIFATGLGAVNPPVPSGQAASSPAPVTATVSVRFDNLSAAPQYAGLAVGFAGLYQVNVQIPSAVRAPVKVELQAGSATSQSVSIAVQP